MFDLSLLQDAEGNHCASFPTALLQVLQAGAAISNAQGQDEPSTSERQRRISELLIIAQTFNPLSWAETIQLRSLVPDTEQRVHIAAAHRAALCIYLERIVRSEDPNTEPDTSPKVLVAEVISHLAMIKPGQAFFTATAWPAFVAGAETDVLESRQWVLQRFRDLWLAEPWGLMNGAVSALEEVWTMSVSGDASDRDWISHLRKRGVDWLII